MRIVYGIHLHVPSLLLLRTKTQTKTILPWFPSFQTSSERSLALVPDHESGSYSGFSRSNRGGILFRGQINVEIKRLIKFKPYCVELAFSCVRYDYYISKRHGGLASLRTETCPSLTIYLNTHYFGARIKLPAKA